MGPTLAPPIDRYAGRKSAGKKFAESIQGFFEKRAESEANQIENEALERQGISVSGLKGKTREEAIKAAYKSQLKEEELGLRSKYKFEEQENKQKFIEKLFGNTPSSNRESFNEEPSEREIPSVNIENIKDQDVLAAEMLSHGLGSTIQNIKSSAQKKESSEEKEKRRQFESDRAFHSKASDPVVAAAEESLKREPIEKGIDAQLRRDISSGETSGIFPFIVDKLGLESFRNPESARFTSEIKNKFTESLQDIPGARPNQFIERFLSTAQPQLGRSVEANLSVLDLGAFIKDLGFERAKKIREIAKEDRKEYGYVKNDINERADERLGKFANERQEKMAYDIRRRHEDALESDVDLLDEIIGGKLPPDTPVTRRTMRLLMIKNGNDPEKAVKEAKKLQMTFPAKETYGRYED